MHSILLDGTFYCCRAVLPHLIRRGGGSIVNVCSTAGAHDGVANAVAYVAAKGGVALLSKCLAIDYGKDNVRVNVIIPGPTDTPMLRKFWSSDEIQKSAASLPLARVGDARELAQAVLFLASDQASFITGVLLPVDGGQMAGGLSRKLN
jgi:NAD(P)-dependent dehydrogenase (short-subunit alcohol dehydrogenase family)